MKNRFSLIILSLSLILAIASSPTYAQMSGSRGRGGGTPPSQTQTPGFGLHTQGLSLGLKGSWLDPNGDLAKLVDDGWGGTFSLGMQMNSNLLLEGLISYHSFDVKKDEDIDGGFVPLELGFTAFFGYSGGIRPYLRGHGGLYIGTGDFEETDFGMGGSIGLDIPINSQTSLQVEPQYTIVFQDDLVEYWGINVGLTFTVPSGFSGQR